MPTRQSPLLLVLALSLSPVLSRASDFGALGAYAYFAAVAIPFRVINAIATVIFLRRRNTGQGTPSSFKHRSRSWSSHWGSSFMRASEIFGTPMAWGCLPSTLFTRRFSPEFHFFSIGNTSKIRQIQIGPTISSSNSAMHHFKRPLKITGITLLAGLILGIGAVTWIHHSNLSNRKKDDYASLLGTGIAVVSLAISCPFWFGAAARFGEDRRAAREKKKKEQT